MLIFQLVRLPAEGQKKWNLGANNAVSGSTSEDLSEYRSNRQLQLNSLPVNTAGLQTGAEHSPPSPPGVCLKTREYGMEVIYSNSDQDYECRDCKKKRLVWRAGIISHLIRWIWGKLLYFVYIRFLLWVNEAIKHVLIQQKRKLEFRRCTVVFFSV